MRFRFFSQLAFVLIVAMLACKKKEKHGSASASLMKSETVSAALLPKASTGLASGSGSFVQSFTPTSLLIPIFRVSLCSGSSSCHSVYVCAADTIAGCGVELSDIDAFVDAINASPSELKEGETFDHIGVEFCKSDERDGIQHITLNGTVDIQGVTYATDPTSGIVRGTSSKATTIDVSGGCASFYPLPAPVTIAEGEELKVKLFFDANLYAFAGIEGGASNTYSYSDTGGCAGTASAYVCAQVVTVVATVDSGNPLTEHYLLANIDSSENNAPTAKTVLYFSSTGAPIGGVQNAYRLSGTTVAWGDTAMGGGLSLIVTKVDDTTVSYGEPGGSRVLVDWFKEFERASHSGTYTFDARGTESEGRYKATKL